MRLPRLDDGGDCTGVHDNELPIDADLVARLVADQFPQWSSLELRRVVSNGTDNAMFRLGDELVVRMPRLPGADPTVEKEQRWPPYLAPHLPVAIPTTVGRGRPGLGYPQGWSILRWLPGELPTDFRHDIQLARDVASFLNAMHGIDPAGGPLATRGRPLLERVEYARTYIPMVADEFDSDRLMAIFEAGLTAPNWDRAPVWVHADVHDENILVRDSRLFAVLDFGACGVGDPACDLMVAWDLFDGDARDVFRAEIEADDATWLRARAWYASGAAGGRAYYRGRHEGMAARSTAGLQAILADEMP